MNCPTCGAKTIVDPDYRPPSGYDPRLERHICTSEFCQTVFFHIRPERIERPARQAEPDLELN